MKLPFFTFALVFLAACAVPDSPSRTGPQGETEIQFQDGKNCWQNKCLKYDIKYRSVAVTGRNPVSISRDIDVRDGYVSEAEFSSMFAAANAALAFGAGRASR
jgi:hypothetical protein